MLQQFYRLSLLNMCTLWSEITLSYRQKLLFEVVRFCCRHTPAFSLVENWFGIFLYRKFLLRVHVADMLNHGRTKNHTDIDNHTDISIGLHLILIRTNQCCYDSSHWLDPSPTRVTLNSLATELESLLVKWPDSRHCEQMTWLESRQKTRLESN